MKIGACLIVLFLSFLIPLPEIPAGENIDFAGDPNGLVMIHCSHNHALSHEQRCKKTEPAHDDFFHLSLPADRPGYRFISCMKGKENVVVPFSFPEDFWHPPRS